ncbi:hypothetical protein EHP00_575 [Ecytonucleospora hepatopenaei]|uniref:Uncharacterized protein n=1 Tax=Ecytonucleospora hepatopenaei TaxID=646526 RepID=A0A1W0E8F4_9MICR|nr:hypothetical protein EHP00_575 [Ecytonucleospora hepatopenaei]
MTGNDDKIKAKIAYKHKLASLKTDILKRIRSELDDTNIEVPFLLVAEVFQRKMKDKIKQLNKNIINDEVEFLSVEKQDFKPKTAQTSMLISDSCVFKEKQTIKSNSSIITNSYEDEELEQVNKTNIDINNNTNIDINNDAKEEKNKLNYTKEGKKEKETHASKSKKKTAKKPIQNKRSKIMHKKQKRHSLLHLADSGSTESIDETKRNINTVIKSFIEPDSDMSVITDSMSFFNK